MMQIPLQISFRNMDPSPAVEARIREKAAKLEAATAAVMDMRMITRFHGHEVSYSGLKTLARVIKSCRKVNKPITLCGEMAGQPRAFVLLFAMGLRSFSMSPAFIPSMKELALHLTEATSHRILRKALSLTATSNVSRFMANQLRIIAPNLQMLDTL